MDCEHGHDCPFLQTALRYQESPEVVEHLQTFKHPVVSCRYGAECNSFRRLEAGGDRLYDVMHLLTFKHPPRVGRPIAMSAGTFTTTAEPEFGLIEVACRHYRPTGYHQCLFEAHRNRQGWPPRKNSKWAPEVEDLVREVVREGFEHELQIPGRSRTLQQEARDKARHPRNTGGATAAEILAVILYTGTQIFAAYNADKRQFYDRCRSDGQCATPRFPVLDLLLMRAKDHIEADSTLDLSEWALKPEGFLHCMRECRTLWCGMHNRYISLEDRRHGSLILAQEQSMSRARDQAEHFLAGEGTLFKCTYRVYACHHAPELMAASSPVRKIMADLSWISKFPSEEEVLVEAGAKLHIKRITALSRSPLVELVECELWANRDEVPRWEQELLAEVAAARKARNVRASS